MCFLCVHSVLFFPLPLFHFIWQSFFFGLGMGLFCLERSIKSIGHFSLLWGGEEIEKTCNQRRKIEEDLEINCTLISSYQKILTFHFKQSIHLEMPVEVFRGKRRPMLRNEDNLVHKYSWDFHFLVPSKCWNCFCITFSFLLGAMHPVCLHGEKSNQVGLGYAEEGLGMAWLFWQSWELFVSTLYFECRVVIQKWEGQVGRRDCQWDIAE